VLLGLTVVMGLYAVCFAAAEVMYRRGSAPEVTRKAVHIGAGVVSALLPWFVDLRTTVAIGVFFAAVLLWTRKRRLLGSVHGARLSSRHGAVLFPVGVVLCALLFWDRDPLIFQGGVLILALADGTAGVLGRRYGKRGYDVSGHKTLEGSLVFLLVALAVMVSVVLLEGRGLEPPRALLLVLGALGVTAVEGLLGRGWDNLLVPVCGGMALQWVL
jgi:phytol kinase